MKHAFELLSAESAQNPTLLWKRLTKSGTSASWLAPETYNEEELTVRMDMFPVELLFGFILTGGRWHVYDGGNKEDRIIRMRTSQPMTLTLEHLGDMPGAARAFNLIVGLVTPESCDRPTSAMILKHPIFLILNQYPTVKYVKLTVILQIECFRSLKI